MMLMAVRLGQNMMADPPKDVKGVSHLYGRTDYPHCYCLLLNMFIQLYVYGISWSAVSFCCLNSSTIIKRVIVVPFK